MKKLFVILMMVFTLLCFTTVSASADGISWSVDAEGTLTISGSGAMEDYTSASAVPWASEDIYAVVVEEGVTHVGSYAFGGLFLDNVLLPETLESIGDNAFYGAAVTDAHFAGNLKQWRENVTLGSDNTALTDALQFDKDVTYQGEGFSLANGVVTSTVPALPSEFRCEYNDYVFEVVFVDVTEIGAHACGGQNDMEADWSLTNITSVTIPDGVTSIGYNAFDGCSSLTSVTIPDSVTSFGGCAFSCCTSLTSVAIPKGVTSIEDGMFLDCSSLTSVTIPDSVTSIGGHAFYGCSSLMSVTIPDSVTSIGFCAFSGCSGLTSVTIGNSVTNFGDYAFSDCSGLKSVHINSLDAWCGIYFGYGDSNPLTFAHNLYIDGILVQELIIPDSLTSIGDNAFVGCNSLTSVTIPDSVTSIGGDAFAGCTGLTSVTIPDSVTSIGGDAFAGCTGLTSVTIPDSVTSIGEGAFYSCGNLLNIYYSGTAAMWNEITIGDHNDALLNAAIHCALAAGKTGDCRWSLSESGTLRIYGNGRMADYAEGAAPWYGYRGQITTIDIKDMVKYLGSYAFSGLVNVPAVSGMTGVTGVGEGAFKDCAALAALTLPAAVTSVGQNAFSGCTPLTSAGPAGSGATIEFGWNRAIPANAFNGADCLESLTIPEGVTRMMASAAANCTALTAVSLPTTLSNIQQNAFSGCTALNAITLPDALKTLGASAFQNTGLTSVTIPVNVTSIGNYSFDGSSLTDVYYPGSRSQWNAITVGADNTALSGAAYHFGSFDITFDTDGGGVIDTMTLAVGSVIVPPANPTKAEFIFACWDPALPATMPANDFTVKAIWALPFGTPDFTLPAAISQIEEEAFAGVTAMTVVEIPEGCEAIARWAFKDCSGLTQIRIPASVTTIDDLAFAGCTDVFVYGTSSSAAKTFCDLHTNCTFVAENIIE